MNKRTVEINFITQPWGGWRDESGRFNVLQLQWIVDDGTYTEVEPYFKVYDSYNMSREVKSDKPLKTWFDVVDLIIKTCGNT